MLCRHCQKGKVSRPRGLCWNCYYRPGIRGQHPSTSKYGRRGLGNFNRNVPLPPNPTPAAPGTEAKIRILTERAHQSLELFHPLDGTAA
jgi:hypothetical protein